MGVHENDNSDSPDMLEEGLAPNPSNIVPIDGKNFKCTAESLSGPLLQNKNKKLLSPDAQLQPANVNNTTTTTTTAADEWMKAKRLIKVASLFQRRLNKGDRSLSDPEIEIPNEFAEETQRSSIVIISLSN